jgi:hypothetical protein
VLLLVFLIIRVFASAPLAHQTFQAILGRPTASRALPVGANFVVAPPRGVISVPTIAVGLDADLSHFPDLVVAAVIIIPAAAATTGSAVASAYTIANNSWPIFIFLLGFVLNLCRPAQEVWNAEIIGDMKRTALLPRELVGWGWPARRILALTDAGAA